MAKINNVRELALQLNLYSIASGKVNLKNEKISNLEYLELVLSEELAIRKNNRII